MTMNYCGRCGSANGTSARFCRQCGAELGSQAAFSSPAAPLNVEFSAKPVMKEPQQENKPMPPESKSSLRPTPDHQPPEAIGEAAAGQETSDPVSISKSLRRVRASGPLIIEAAKKQQDQMNQIIAQAIEGFENKTEEPTAPPKPPAAPPFPTRPRAESPTTTTAPPVPRTTDSLAKTPAADPVKTSVTAQVTPSVQAARRTTHAMAAVTRPGSGSLMNSSSLPPNGPSSVLAQASGLNPQSGVGSKLRVAIISLALLGATGAYFVFRDRLLTQPRASESDRDLMRVEDQSAQLIKLGERDRDQGRLETALEYFQRAISLTPNNPTVHFLAAQTFLDSGQTEEALKAYKSLLRIAPEHLEARLKVAEIYRLRGNWNAAYQEYQRIIALDQNSGQAAAALEAIEAHQSGAPELPVANNTVRRPRAPARISPVMPPSAAAQAQISLLPQKLLTAPTIKPPEALSGNKPEDNPDPRAVADTRKKLGLRYFNVREYRAAINEFLAALRLTPDDKDIYYFLGSSYYGLGQHALAHDYYKRVDRGQYVQVAQSGAQRTEKAAREEFKRRMDMLKNDAQNEVKNSSEVNQDPGANNSAGKAILNSYK